MKKILLYIFSALFIFAASVLHAEQMVLIPAGTFQMGDNLDGDSIARPVHMVTLSSFYIGKYDITNQQYCDFLNSADIKVVSGIVYASSDSGNDYPYCDTSSGSTYSQIAHSGGVFSVRTKVGRNMSSDPIVYVSWYGAVAYCNWRSQQEGKELCYNLSTWNCDFTKSGYRLPTEAEWEYAARGGLSGRRFPWGNNIDHSRANYVSSDKYSYDQGGPPWGYHPMWNDSVPCTSPVDSFPPNGYGLYDMTGNVSQWCNDRYGPYSSGQQTNPTGPTTGIHRVLRGGCWYYQAPGCRTACRFISLPSQRNFNHGFRISLPQGVGNAELVLETSPRNWALGMKVGIVAYVQIDGRPQSGWTITGTITNPYNASQPLSFTQVGTNFRAEPVLDGSAGFWTIDVKAQKGSEELTASSILQVVYKGPVSVAIRNRFDKAAYEFTENDFVFITVSNGTSDAVKFTVSALVKNTPTDGEVSHVEYDSPEITASDTKTFAIPALPVFHYSNPNRYAYHVVDVYVGGSIATSTIFEGKRNDFLVKHASGVKPDMILLTEPERLRECFESEDSKDWWDGLQSTRQEPYILGLIHKMCQDRGVLVYTCIGKQGGNAYSVRKELSQISEKYRQDNTPIDYLCLLGGHDVIPMFRTVDSGNQEGWGDWGYWCENTWLAGGAEDVAAVYYGRLPCRRSPNRYVQERINYRVFSNPLINMLSGISSLYIYDALMLGGTAGDPYYDPLFLEPIRNAINLPIKNKKSHTFDPHTATPPYHCGQAYSEEFLKEEVEMLFANGHSSGNSIFSGLPWIGALNYPLVWIDTDRVLRFSNDSLYGPGLTNSVIDLSTGEKLNKCLVMLGGCHNAWLEQEDYLADVFLESGAIACVANSGVADIAVSKDFLNGYVDAIRVGGSIGQLFRSANHGGWGDWNSNVWVKTNLGYLQDAQYTFKNYMQLGYPKQMVVIGNSHGISINATQYMSSAITAEALVTNLTMNIQDYNFNTDPYGTANDVVSYTALVNGEAVTASQWDLAGNPLLPYEVHVFSLPSDITVSQVSVTSDATNLGVHIIAESPERWNASGMHEYWPLGYATYMPDIVQWNVWNNPDGSRKLGLAIFPFQYTPATSNLVMHDQINVNISYTNITAGIQSASFTDEEVLKGSPAILSIVATGDCNLIVKLDGNETAAQSQVSSPINVFSISTAKLNAGPHTARIRCEVNEALNDEASISFSVYDCRFEFNDIFAQSAIQQGTPLRVSWDLTNAGVNQEDANVVLECYNGDQFFTTDVGIITLDSNQTSTMAAYLPTESLVPGLASIRIKADVNGWAFSSAEIQTVITILDTDGDGMSDLWEQQIIDANWVDGITSIEKVMPGDDFDHDGYSNLEEYQAETSPIDPANHPLCQFGSFDGRKNIKLTLKDCNNNDVTFSLTGGGYGEIDCFDCKFSNITLYNTTEKSIFSIKTKGNVGTSVGDIICNGPMKGISAKGIDITGDIEIGSSTNQKSAVTILFDEASALTIDSDMPIKSITATEWVGGAVNASSIGSLTIKGDAKRGISGDLYDVDLNLSQGPDAKVKALGKLTVKGWIDSSQILSQGNIGTVTAGGMLKSCCFTGIAAVSDVNVPDGVLDLPGAVEGNFDGAATIKKIEIKGIKTKSPPYVINSNIAAAQILNATLSYPDNNNVGVPFGLSAGFIKSLKVKEAEGTVSFKNLDKPSDADYVNGVLAGDDVQIRLY